MNPALSELLQHLASLHASQLYDDSDGSGDSYLSALVEEWQATGFPGIDQGESIPAGFDDLCMIEVTPPHRGSRGRFWMPKGHGYTDDPKQAGLFTADEARALVRSGKTRAVLPVTE